MRNFTALLLLSQLFSSVTILALPETKTETAQEQSIIKNTLDLLTLDAAIYTASICAATGARHAVWARTPPEQRELAKNLVWDASMEAAGFNSLKSLREATLKVAGYNAVAKSRAAASQIAWYAARDSAWSSAEDVESNDYEAMGIAAVKGSWQTINSLLPQIREAVHKSVHSMIKLLRSPRVAE